MSTELTPLAWKTKFRNSTAKAVFALLADGSNSDGYSFPSVDYIADRTELSRRQVLRILQVFREIGLVEQQDYKTKGKYRYSFQITLEMMGKDLALQFKEAFDRAQRRDPISQTDPNPVSQTDPNPVSQTGNPVSQTLNPVSQTYLLKPSNRSNRQLTTTKNNQTPPFPKTEREKKPLLEAKPALEEKKQNPILGEIEREVKALLPVFGDADDFREQVKTVLVAKGFECFRRVAVADRGDGYRGFVELVAVRDGCTIALELDRVTPRRNSAEKLRQIAADFRVLVLREGVTARVPDGIDDVWCCGWCSKRSMNFSPTVEFSPKFPAETGSVIRQCHFSESDTPLKSAIDEQIFLETDESGAVAMETAEIMIHNWREFQALGELRAYVWSPATFFAQGHWRKPLSWPVDQKLLSRRREANVGSWRPQ